MGSLEEMNKAWIFDEEWGFGGQAPANADCECWGRALLTCANGDGAIADAERAWVLGYSATNGLSPDDIEFLRTYSADEDITKVVAERPLVSGARRALIFDAIRACSADGELSNAERKMIYRMAELIGIGKDIVDQLEAAYNDELAAKQARWKIAFPEGAPS